MSLKALQSKIGATPDGSFGPTTMKKAMGYFKMTPSAAAHFFGQVSHETGGFTIFTENLNYSVEGLQKIFGKYFPGNLEESYAKNPQKIANRVYASRMGNGNEASGDGWKFRGRGALQLTGKDNYQAFANSLQKPEIMTNPDLVATDFAFESAIFFFNNNRLWNLCNTVDQASILKLSKAINLGSASSKGTPHGLEDRVEKTLKYFQYVK
jgi:putative chitinase